MKKEFENMKREEKWSKMLNKTSWPHFKTVHRKIIINTAALAKDGIVLVFF